MANNPEQLTEPLEFPQAVIGKLCDALNAANDEFRAYFKSCGIELHEDYLSITEHQDRKKLLKAATDYHKKFLHNIPALMAAQTKGSVM